MSSQLQAGSQVTLATVSGVVTGRITLGPTDQRGPAKWNVEQILIKTSRPGVAPIPRLEIYIDDPNAGNLQALTYDGSFGSAGGSCTLIRGQSLTAIWTGGLVGDIATFTVTGTKE